MGGRSRDHETKSQTDDMVHVSNYSKNLVKEGKDNPASQPPILSPMAGNDKDPTKVRKPKASKKQSKKQSKKPTLSPTKASTKPGAPTEPEAIAGIIRGNLTVDLSNGTNINSRQLRRILSDEFSEGFKELLKQTIQQLVELGLENNQLLIDVSITNITLSESTLFFGFRIALLQQCITSCREVLQTQH